MHMEIGKGIQQGVYDVEYRQGETLSISGAMFVTL